MLILTLKALHLIAMVTWFAGLFYLVRLFVYHAESRELPIEKGQILVEQYMTMERRLFYIITWPGMVLTWLCGVGMLIANPLYLGTREHLAWWLYIKLALVLILTVYHLICGKWMRELAGGKSTYTGKHFRMLNEVATIILVAVVFLAVMRNLMNFLYGFVGIVLFVVLLFLGIRLYKRIRENQRRSDEELRL